jgi:hypothetical protein
VSIPAADKRAGVRRLESVSGLPGGIEDGAERRAFLRSRYGLGDRRTLAQAVQFSGFQLSNRTSLGNRCGNLQHVPFTEHPRGAAYIPPFHPLTFAPLDAPDVGSIYYDPAEDARDRPATLLPRQNTGQPMMVPHFAPPKEKLQLRGEAAASKGAVETREGSQSGSGSDSGSDSGSNSNSGIGSVSGRSETDNMMHVLAFVAIIFCPVSVIMCCLGRCSLFTGLLSGLWSDNEKASGKFT